MPRLALAGIAIALTGVASVSGAAVPPGALAALGVVAFLCIAGACSSNLRAVSWRTVAWGLGLQLLLALFVLKFSIGGVRPGYVLFSRAAALVAQFLGFTDAGARFVFGGLADPDVMSQVFPGGFVLAFTALPAIVFVSSFFTILFHLGIVQVAVGAMAKLMMAIMKTSGAETLSAVANVFMGMTEAPLIIRPYVPAMTQSELCAVMAGGLATVSGGMMVVYVGLGADPIALLATSVMAAPAGLYLAKILYPETAEPVTRGEVRVAFERPHRNVIDAAAAGASDGMFLALNVAAMLIAFLALIAMVDAMLGFLVPGLSLAGILGFAFAPIATLMGVPPADVPAIADLLGTKLVANEMVAFIKLTTEYKDALDPRSQMIAAFALNGFANLGSVGVLLGGIGAMAPGRRGDLAALSTRALLAGFLATLINASIASVLL